MSPLELCDCIRSWLWLNEHLPFPVSSDPEVIELNRSVLRSWEIEMLNDIAKWEIPIEFSGTPVEEDLRMVISYAKAADRTKINDIQSILSNILKYITPNITIIENPSCN